MRPSLLCLSLLVWWSTPLEAQLYARDAPKATLTVKVVNGTSDGADVTGDRVVVAIYDKGRPADNLDGKVGPDGVAVFDAVASGEQVAAVAFVHHSDMTFSSGLFQLSGGQTAFAVTVDVYERSTDRASIVVRTHHLIIAPQAESLLITEYMQFDNPTDRAISSLEEDDQGRKKVIRINLPGGFRNLTFQDYFEDKAVVVTEGGFYDVLDMPPGEHAAKFSYTLDIPSQTLEITKRFSIPAEEFMVFSLLEPGSVQGLGKPAGKMQIGDRMAEYFEPVGAAANQEITFNVRGSCDSKSEKTTIVAVVVVAVVAGLVAILLYRRRKEKLPG